MNLLQNLWISLDLHFFQHGCLSRWMMKILVCRVWIRRNIAAFVSRLEIWNVFLRIVCLVRNKPSSKAHSTQHTLSCFRNFWSKGSIFTVSFTKERALFWARACLLYMHESSLLTYMHIPSVFHNQRPCNGYRELYSRRNIDFTL